MKKLLLQQLIDTDRDIDQTKQKIQQNIQDFKSFKNQTIPKLQQFQQRMKQLSEEQLPQPQMDDYEASNFLVLNNMQNTLKLIQSISDSKTLSKNVDYLLQQGKFRQAIKSFLHVKELDVILNQSAMIVHKDVLEKIMQAAKQSIEQQADYFQRIKTDEFLLLLFCNQQEMQFTSQFTQFLSQIQKTILPSDYVKQLSILTQAAHSHLNLLLETLFGYSQDVICYQLASLYEISLEKFQNESISQVLRVIQYFMLNYIKEFTTQKDIDKNTFANSLQVTLSLAARFEMLVNTQIKKFNQGLADVKKNLLDDTTRSRFVEIEQYTGFNTLISDLCLQYIQTEKDYLIDHMNQLLSEQNAGNEFFQLIKHILTRIDDTTIDSNYFDKFKVKQQVVGDFCNFLIQQADRVIDLMTIHQIYSKISKIHQFYEKSDDIFTLYQQKLTQQLNQRIKQFFKQEFSQYVQKFVITGNIQAAIDYLDFIQQNEQDDQLVQQVVSFFASPYSDKAMQLLIQQFEQFFIQFVLQLNKPISTSDLVTFSKQLGVLQNYFTTMLHRSCVEEFKNIRRVVFVLGSQKKAEALETGVGLPEEVILDLCRVQGIE